MSSIDGTEIDKQIAASIKKFTLLAREGRDDAGDDENPHQRPIIEMPEFVRNKAQLLSAHLLLPPGSRVVDMGCGQGAVTYMLAALNPYMQIVGIDIDPEAIAFAQKNFELPNLSFRQSDITLPDFEDESVDGIINSNILYQIYSEAGYDTHAVTDLMERQVAKLKTGGMMLVRDYIAPPPDELVLLELPDAKREVTDIMGMADPDLLLLYAREARPMESGAEGFFIEEISPVHKNTRLFRLPHKWAKEFIHRKDYRGKWKNELKQEYTFFTWQDYKREFTRMGMRMAFSAPYWNPWVVKNCFQGRFQLYDQEGQPLQPPPTNYFIVAQKVADRQSLTLEERRPSQKPVGDLQIMVVRDKNSGRVHELVRRPGEHCDIVPYRITPDGRLMIYVRSGYPRPIVNAVPRGGHNLDGKRWSGHLVEPITMDTINMTDDVEENRQMIFNYIESYAGLRTKDEDRWYVGETYFPSPDRIDEAIEPVFVEVENPDKPSWPISADAEIAFTELGMITELDAADIFQASQIGLLPDPRLELHVFELMSRYGISFPRWIGEALPQMPKSSALKTKKVDDLLKDLPAAEFSKEDKSPVHLRPVKSVFVEEGRVGRSTRGLSAQDIEFVVTDNGVENIAIVIPLSRDWDDNLLVALEPKVMPVPNRLGGDGGMLNAPSFVLPNDVRSVEDARAFIAKTFSVPPDRVVRLGESYFTHTGVTPQRIYPFAVVSARTPPDGTQWHFTTMKYLWAHVGFSRYAGELFKALARVHVMVADNHDMSVHRNPINLKRTEMKLSTDKVAVETRNSGYSGLPSRVLGKRTAPDLWEEKIPDDLRAQNEEEEKSVFDPDAAHAAKKTPDRPDFNHVSLQKGPVPSREEVRRKIEARIGSLSNVYARAMSMKYVLVGSVNLDSTTEVAEIDRHIGAVARQLHQLRGEKEEQDSYTPGPKGRF